MFAFENLDVYQRAVKFVGKIERLTGSLRSQIAYAVIDQLTRAALSVPLNIAEGNGRWHQNDKKKFFWIARGSLFEIVPILQVIKEKGACTTATNEELYGDLVIMAKMITNLIKAVDTLNHKAVPQ